MPFYYTSHDFNSQLKQLSGQLKNGSLEAMYVA